MVQHRTAGHPESRDIGSRSALRVRFMANKVLGCGQSTAPVLRHRIVAHRRGPSLNHRVHDRDRSVRTHLCPLRPRGCCAPPSGDGLRARASQEFGAVGRSTSVSGTPRDSPRLFRIARPELLHHPAHRSGRALDSAGDRRIPCLTQDWTIRGRPTASRRRPVSPRPRSSGDRAPLS